jgi:RPA family protein
MDDKQPIQRQTAYKCSIASLNKGIFVKKQGWEPSYVMTGYGDFSRINIIAVIISKEENSVTADDGTGSIMCRVFSNPEQLDRADIGDAVLIIGRPREFNNKIYVTLEIIRKVSNGWLNYRRKELLLLKKIRDMADFGKIPVAEPEVVESTSTIDSKEKIIRLMNSLDSGNGASIEDIIKMSKVSNAEDILNDMVLKGEIFEIKPGQVKTL